MKFYKPFKATHFIRDVPEVHNDSYDGFTVGTLLQQMEGDLYRSADNVCSFVSEYLVDEIPYVD